MESIKKRFVTFRESSMPVVEFYEKLGKVRKSKRGRYAGQGIREDQGKFRAVRLIREKERREREREMSPLCV